MKKTLLISFALLFLSTLGYAQQKQSEPLQMDESIRYGKLENGLTYYIKYNKLPEKRADFYIAQRVGSMQEEDNQRGLAHFLEHMAFNGTKNYPGDNTLLNYLETIGVKFGNNVNAYTSLDETVYNITSVPLTREAIVDSVLLILHDWSGYIELTEKEIDKERPVIEEEWRTRNNSGSRIMEKKLLDLYPHEKYANRLPIGSMDVVRNFKYQELRDYYHKWYRPDLQAIVVVGDIDVNQIEQKIKDRFSSIPMPKDAPKRIYYPVADNNEPIISILTDKEQTWSSVSLFIKHDLLPKDLRNTTDELYQSMITSMISDMFGMRLSEMALDPEAPFSSAWAYYGDYYISRTKKAWTLGSDPKEGRELDALQVLLRENKRMQQHGFTEPEIKRAKAKILSNAEKSYNDRNTKQNSHLVSRYVNNFTNDIVTYSEAFYFDYVKKNIDSVTLDQVNAYARSLVKNDNMAVTITGPEKEGLILPTKDNVKLAIDNLKRETVDAYLDTTSDKDLIGNLPQRGKVVKEEKEEALGATILTLSNGMRVMYKKTDFKDDEVLMSILSLGGSAKYGVEERVNTYFASSIPYMSGVGEFSSIDLRKYLTGKRAYVSANVSKDVKGFNGSSSNKDLETLFELTHLNFTSPRLDKEAYKNQFETIKSEIRNTKNTPYKVFNDSVMSSLNLNDPWLLPLTEENIDEIDLNRAFELYKDLYANPGAFTAVFVGSIDEDKLREYSEIYLASLPSGKDLSNVYPTVKYLYRKGEYEKRFEQQMENPKVTNMDVFSGHIDFTIKDFIHQKGLSQLLDIIFTRTVREEAGGTYGVYTNARLTLIPQNGDASLTIRYDTSKEKVDSLNIIIAKELNKVAKGDVQDEDFNKVKENLLKVYNEELVDNGYWLRTIFFKHVHKVDFHAVELDILNNMNKTDLSNILNRLIDQGNHVKVTMMPKSE